MQQISRIGNSCGSCVFVPASFEIIWNVESFDTFPVLGRDTLVGVESFDTSSVLGRATLVGVESFDASSVLERATLVGVGSPCSRRGRARPTLTDALYRRVLDVGELL